MTAFEIDGLSNHARHIADLARKLGLTVTKSGRVWRVFGNGVDIQCASLALIRPDELRPYR